MHSAWLAAANNHLTGGLEPLRGCTALLGLLRQRTREDRSHPDGQIHSRETRGYVPLVCAPHRVLWGTWPRACRPWAGCAVAELSLTHRSANSEQQNRKECGRRVPQTPRAKAKRCGSALFVSCPNYITKSVCGPRGHPSGALIHITNNALTIRGVRR